MQPVRSRLFALTLSLTLATFGILSGCGKSADDTTAQTPPPAIKPLATSPKMAVAGTDGATLFASNCAGCHGAAGVGGQRAPVLAGKKTPEDETVKIVTEGKKPKMPAFKGRLTDDQIKAVAKYVATL